MIATLPIKFRTNGEKLGEEDEAQNISTFLLKLDRRRSPRADSKVGFLTPSHIPNYI